MTNIFASNAPKYWAKGLAAIPCGEKSKRALPQNWSAYSETMPDEATRNQWLRDWPNGNIGLVLGQQSNICVIDVDTDDPKVLNILDKLLPPSPWQRRGKKGFVRAFKYSGHRTFRIITMEGKPVMELLSRGAQVILPPSIHPDTQQPYQANCDLVDVLDQLNALPKDIETILRESLVEAGVSLSTRGSTKITDFVAAGARDSTMTAMAGLLARAVTRGERKLAETFDEMNTWLSTFVQKVAGDDVDPKKAQDKVVYFLKRDVLESKRMLPKGWDDGLSQETKDQLKSEFGEQAEEWTLDRFLDVVQKKFEEHPMGDPARVRVVDELLMRAGRQKNLTSFEEETLMQTISTGSNRGITMASMRRRLAELRAGEIMGSDHSELARELLKELERYGEVRMEADQFYQWAGSHWKVLDRVEIYKLLSNEFGHFPAAKKSNDHRGIVYVLSNIVPHGLQDTEVEGINFANGFLSLDGELFPHAPKFGSTYVLPYRYTKEAAGACPRFMSFLHDSWGDEPDYAERVQALREAIAATMFGVAYKYSRAICLHGIPHSGKSTLMKIVMGLLPEEAISQVSPQDWHERFRPIQMSGKLLNFCGELSEDAMIAGDRFKSIVEGELMSAEYKGRDAVMFRPRCAHWFATNHLPNTRDTSSGFNRRWLFFTFQKQFPPSRRINSLEIDILSQEREAIVAWVIEAMNDLRARQEYTIPASHVDCVREMANRNNAVRYFFAAGGVEIVQPQESSTTSSRTSERELYTRYFAFCRSMANARPVSLPRFRLMAAELQQDLGFKIQKVFLNGAEDAWYHNVTLVDLKVA